MKNNILLASLGGALIATGLGVAAVLSQHSYGGGDLNQVADAFITTGKLYQLAGISGLFSISSFFVGWVYPAPVIVQNSTDGTYSKIAV